MNILYGVSGEGFGHSSRAKEIIQHLQKQNHQVLIITYGQAYEVLKDKFNCLKIEGIHLQFEENKLSLIKTAQQSLEAHFQNFKDGMKIKSEIDKFNPDICITDYEPITAIISFWYKLPLISIDNQHLFTHAKIQVPQNFQKDFLIAKHVTDICVSKANAFIIFTFANQKSKKDVFFVDPLIRTEVQKLKTKKSDYIIVYQTKPNPQLLEILKEIPEKFIIYGYNEEDQSGNLQFKKSGPHFIHDLAHSKAVISTAGLSLLSESIFLKKPFFALPLPGQFEQTFNAIFLEHAGYGDWQESPTREKIQHFIDNLHNYESNLKKYKMNPNEVFPLLDKILKRIKK